jgi:hypothetical protein
MPLSRERRVTIASNHRESAAARRLQRHVSQRIGLALSNRSVGVQHQVRDVALAVADELHKP